MLRQGGDDLGRFHADSDDLSDEADDVLGVVGVVGVRADAGALVFLHAVLIDDPLDVQFCKLLASLRVKGDYGVISRVGDVH